MSRAATKARVAPPCRYLRDRRRRCPRPRHPVYGDRCEDCWAEDQQHWHGQDQSVSLWGRPSLDTIDPH